jgi:penicillin-binding protein 1A
VTDGIGRRIVRALWHPRGIRQRAVSAALVVVLLLTGGGGFLVTYAALTLPDPAALDNLNTSIRFLDRNGAVIATVNRNNAAASQVPLNQVAPVMQQALIAAEDRNFYSEGGFDPTAILRAAAHDVTGGGTEGASTITQQLARIDFLSQERSVMRKLREILLADEIDHRYSKDDILAAYLNAVYFGHGAYGIAAAAQVYFGTTAASLSLSQAALLAGLLQAPSADDPFANPSAAFSRQHYVLTSMVAAGDITTTAAQAVDPLAGDTAQHQKAMLDALTHGRPVAEINGAPHFVAYAREQLDTLFSSDLAALDGSVDVTTSLDLGTQVKAQKAVAAGVAAIGRNANNGALLMLDSHSGDILAMVGSADYNNAGIGGEFNVTVASRRPGSSFKPFVFEQAFRSGALRPNSVLQDTAAESAMLGGVNDFDGNFMGAIAASQALLLSRNVATEQAMETAGVTNVIDFAHQLGISSPLAANASTAIGTSAVRMIDQAAAYAAFANGGQTVTPRAILKVVDHASGTVLYVAGRGSAGASLMTPAQAYQVTGILRRYDSQWSVPITRDAASKSGTTDRFVDAWYMTYTPSWVVATWAGHTSGTDPAEVGIDGVYGVDAGAHIAAPFVNQLPATPAFTVPPGATDPLGGGATPGGGNGGGNGDKGGGKGGGKH